MSEPQTPQAIELNVTGMNCGHCQKSVEKALGEIDGVRGVTVDLKGGRATVTGEDLDPAPMIERIVGLGFDAEVRAG